MLPPPHANPIQALSQLRCVATKPEGESGEQLVQAAEAAEYLDFQTPAAKVQLRASVLFLPAWRPRGGARGGSSAWCVWTDVSAPDPDFPHSARGFLTVSLLFPASLRLLLFSDPAPALHACMSALRPVPLQGRERLLLIQNGSFAVGVALVLLAAGLYYGTADDNNLAGARPRRPSHLFLRAGRPGEVMQRD